ncbi:MAG: histidine--tRNA ligase [Spirochaetaceae bacterium]|jgi:histidyl-tRNA synthetase|nr:histidine--tRNA ligase [Spirochaetaceae bacterium]
MIEPRLLKGFRDFLPDAEIAKKTLEEKIEAVFRLMGFAPIDTPALEYADVLFGKGGGETDKQGYRFEDAGGRAVALRFDLTVPFARFAALHLAELPMPFKRYHIAKVWRGENTQRGRYREFTQCDFDIIGTDGAAADFEILLTMHKALSAIAGNNVTIRVNHRGLFNRFLARIGAENQSVEALRTVDKLAKIGKPETGKQLAALLGEKRAEQVLAFTAPRAEDAGKSASWDETLAKITELAGGDCEESARLRQIHSFLRETGVAASFVLDPSVARGLDYYTGIVFESFLDALPGIGSVCSGGRYDNLAGLYCKQRLSGVGASVGLDRLIAALETLGKPDKTSSYAKAAVACVKAEDSGKYQAAAEKLRAAGIACEVFLEPAKLAAQYQAAEKKGIPFVVITEENGGLTLRDLAKRENRAGLALEEAVALLQAG